MTAGVIVFLCCSISYLGCKKNKYNELDARLSPEWVKDAVIYEIDLYSVPRNGSFKALEEQIPELKKLGITVISLMPIYPIGELNRRGIQGSPYAIKNFYTVNAEYGTLDDFKSLINTVHQQGLKIIINLVANQTAWDSDLIMEHPDWFVHNEEGAIVSPSIASSDVAQVDYDKHELRKYMITMMKFWVQEVGIDGFQCRASESIPTDFWSISRKELDKIKPVLMISESRFPEHHIKAFDLTCSWNMNKTITNIVSGMVPASVIDDSLNSEFHQFPKNSLHLRFKTIHDENIEDSSGIEKFNPLIAKTIAILSFTLPGVPIIYTSDRTGDKKQVDLSNKLYKDLCMLRRNHPALRHDLYREVQNSKSYFLFSFIRFSGKDSVLVVVNFANEKKEAEIQMPAEASLLWKDQFTGIRVNVKDSRLNIDIAPLGFMILTPFSSKEM